LSFAETTLAMNLISPLKTFAVLLCSVALASTAPAAERKIGQAATIHGIEIKGDAMPGGKVTAVVKVKLDEGYHVHSNKPSEPQYIATELTLGTAAGARAGTISYPAGKSQKVQGLDKPLSVFEGEFELSIPIGLTSSAKLPLTIPATLGYQACKGAQCYAPQKLKFDIKIDPKQ
jgi:DsbC/DsbD-like thiol-disulfide interchange protein